MLWILFDPASRGRSARIALGCCNIFRNQINNRDFPAERFRQQPVPKALMGVYFRGKAADFVLLQNSTGFAPGKIGLCSRRLGEMDAVKVAGELIRAEKHLANGV